VTGISSGPWRAGLAALGGPTVSAVLTVQCATDWLRPAARGLRDEIDTALMAALLARGGLLADRVLLHNPPVAPGRPAGEQTALTAAHLDWMYRQAAAAALLPEGRLRVHRLIIAGGRHSEGVVDGMFWSAGGAWSDPDAAARVWKLVHRGAAATPLTSYDVDMDGPFGDGDPSVYL
jgi:hypothetical protein